MPPNSNRTSSIPVVSASSLKCDSTIKKKFACSFAACGKSFSRSEHLHRHALNHKDGNNTCLRCMAHFRRRDLLDRHMARHKEKDDEAGGEGLGILATRKRLWRDADGNIVNSRRPSYTHDASKSYQIGRTEKQEATPPYELVVSNGGKSPAIPSTRISPTPSAASTVLVNHEMLGVLSEQKSNESQPDSWLEMTALPSPPISEPDTPPVEISDNLESLYEDSWPAMLNSVHEIVNTTPVVARPSDYSPSPLWGIHPFQTFMGAISEGTHDEMFRLETGLYDWQPWNGQVMMSRCREDKFEKVEGRKKEYVFHSTQDEIFRR